jgi:histidinol-phosphate aminotransferase
MPDRLEDLVPEGLRALRAYHVPRPANVRAKLDANELPFSLPEDVAAALGRELAAVDLNRYPASDCGELRALIASELGVAADALVFGNGSDELIGMLISAFSQPRAGARRPAVLYPVPSFVVFRIASLAGGADPVEIPLDDEFQLDGGALERAMAERRPNVAFFARPNNPTGTLWSKDLVAQVARRHPDTVVVSDEAYADYGGESMLDLIDELPNLVVMRTLSKMGLAALRVGFLVARPQVVHELEKVRPPYNVGALNQRAATWLLREHGGRLRARCQEVVAERARLAALLAGLPDIRAFDSHANLILFRVGAAGDGRATAVWQALADRGVLVRSFDGPGPLSGCLRVSIGTPEENALFGEALAAALAETAP